MDEKTDDPTISISDKDYKKLRILTMPEKDYRKLRFLLWVMLIISALHVVVGVNDLINKYSKEVAVPKYTVEK